MQPQSIRASDWFRPIMYEDFELRSKGLDTFRFHSAALDAAPAVQCKNLYDDHVGSHVRQ